jgi:hypothetical protein
LTNELLLEFLRKEGLVLVLKKPDRITFAAHMHFIVSDKNNVNIKRNIREMTR